MRIKTENRKTIAELLGQIKTDIQQSQLIAALSVTKELTLLYWRIGKMLSEKITIEGWGAKVIEKLARDLASSFLSGLIFLFAKIHE